MRAHVVSDKELISSYLSGNQSSLETLISRHQSRIFTYILMIVKDKELADDLFQDTFIKVINTLRSGSYNEEGKFIQWVMRIAHNLTIDYFRKSNRMPKYENSRDDFDIFSTIKFNDKNVEEKWITRQIHEDVKSLIEFLPPEQKEVFNYASL